MLDGADTGMPDPRTVRFLETIEAIRPSLHRYCARMTGSVADGEDIVQEVLVRAYDRHRELVEGHPLRPWIFRIAHNRAIDWLREYGRRMSRPLESAMDTTDADAPEPGDELVREETVRFALERFAILPPNQRGAVILKDVLDHSLEEIVGILDSSLPAVKASLHRGRARLRRGADRADLPPAGRTGFSKSLVRYASLFNAHDWDGVRAMLAEDVRLDLVSRDQRRGRLEVAHYFVNYEAAKDWHLVPAWLDGREILAVTAHSADASPRYFMELEIQGESIASIKDFRYVPYILQEARIGMPGIRRFNAQV